MKIEFNSSIYVPKVEVYVSFTITAWSDWHGREVTRQVPFSISKYLGDPVTYIITTTFPFEDITTSITEPGSDEEELCDISKTDLGKEVIRLCEENKVFG